MAEDWLSWVSQKVNCSQLLASELKISSLRGGKWAVILKLNLKKLMVIASLYTLEKKLKKYFDMVPS